jgi:hypothetical protein
MFTNKSITVSSCSCASLRLVRIGVQFRLKPGADVRYLQQETTRHCNMQVSSLDDTIIIPAIAQQQKFLQAGEFTYVDLVLTLCVL